MERELRLAGGLQDAAEDVLDDVLPLLAGEAQPLIEEYLARPSLDGAAGCRLTGQEQSEERFVGRKRVGGARIHAVASWVATDVEASSISSRREPPKRGPPSCDRSREQGSTHRSRPRDSDGLKPSDEPLGEDAMKTVAIGIFALWASAVPGVARAGWLSYGNAAVTAAGDQMDPEIALDGNGGLFLVWADYRVGTDADVFIQRLDANGTPLFGDDGVPVCDVPGNQRRPTIVSDGAGGAIVAWEDERPGYNRDDIYVQRVDGSGARLWNGSGVPLCTAEFFQYYAKAVSDGAGGAVVTWVDYRFGSTNSSIYARRVDAAGTPQWGLDGVPISTASNDQYNPRIISDGAGGAIIEWDDTRFNAFGVYARRVTFAGSVMWANNGIYVASKSNFAELATDGAGGAIIVWLDGRAGANDADVYAQRYNAAGVAQWTLGGVSVCVGPFSKRDPAIAADGVGGAIIAWSDSRDMAVSGPDLYARRIDGGGTLTWPETPVCTVQDYQGEPEITTDGAGGAIVTWADDRSHPQVPDIYAARLLASGQVLWVDAVSTVNNAQLLPRILSDGAGGGFFAWMDNRTSSLTGMDVYAARYFGGGVVDVPRSVPAPVLALGSAMPNPCTGPVAFELRLPEPGDVALDVYNVSGRRVAAREVRGLGAGAHRITFDGRDADGRRLESGVYLVRVRTQGMQSCRRISVVR
jgi:hypothetical protein